MTRALPRTDVPEVAPSRLVYILAASHSGSTLLAMLLGAHPDIVTVGEIKATALGAVDEYRCSCRQRIRECPFWNEIRDDMTRRGLSFDVANAGTDVRFGASAYARRLLRPMHRGALLEGLRDVALEFSIGWRRHLERVQTLNVNLMQAVLARTGKKILVDSSKIGLRLKYLMRDPRLDVRVIRLVRDGRGVALTYIDPARFADARDPQWRGGGTGGGRDNEHLTMHEAAREWRRGNEEGEAIIRRCDPSRWLGLRYEELCAAPERTLARVCSFIGVDPTLARTDFRAVEHHVIGNGMRLDETSAIRLDERWRSQLTASDLEIFERVAGALNRRLGYT